MLTCKEYTDLKKKELKAYIKEKNLHPTLVVIQVGDRPESNSYIRGKMRDCEEVGITLIHMVVSEEDVTQRELEQVIRTYNRRDDVHGIIVQLPVPNKIDVKRIQKTIIAAKDVDGFGEFSKFHPCTPKGVIDYLKHIGYEFEGKDALVIGRSDIVGKPLARMLTDLDCTVTLAHSKTKNVIDHMMAADVIFTAIDRIEYYDFMSSYNVFGDIIDIGLGVGEDGKLHGNIAHSELEYLRRRKPNGILISGTGGVGLLTRLALLENVVKACEMQKG